jgi:environmental stress-induced protein Ves
MSIRKISCGDVPPTLWKNGKGLVRDLLHWPNEAQWQARISVADIDVDAPFSVYEDAERWFSVVQGRGVRLQLPDGWHSVVAEGAAIRFRGEDAPVCELIDGPTRDLNLMCRRSAGRAEMVAAKPGVPWSSTATLRALFSADAVTLRDGTSVEQLAPFTLAWAEGNAATWQVEVAMPRPRSWWLAFDAVPR